MRRSQWVWGLASRFGNRFAGKVRGRPFVFSPTSYSTGVYGTGAYDITHIKKAIQNCRIVDSSLREGEQFATTHFSFNDRMYIAKMLDSMGIDYIELGNVVASKNALFETKKIAGLGLNSKLLIHIRNHLTDAKAAVEAGADGVNLYMATSDALRQHSHGKGIEEIIEAATRVITYLQQHKVEIRFSCEDTFRSNIDEVLAIYRAVDQLGVDRVGLADTVGIATPFDVIRTVSAVRSVLKPATGIEFHTHNDSGCCIANAYVALLAGATHIDTSVLGLGERNGITPLGGFLGRLYTIDREEIKSRYDLTLLRGLERYIARCAQVDVPFNNYITGSAAMTHKAGVHSKAVMKNPSSYEVIDPEDFGVKRRVQIAHRLTGWNALLARAKELGLGESITSERVKAATSMIKNLAATQTISQAQIDSVLIELASGPPAPVASSKFVEWSNQSDDPELRIAMEKTAKALAELEVARATAAVKTIERDTELQGELRESRILQVQGHLFDSTVMNRIVDLLVERQCDFKVLTLDLPKNHDDYSSCKIQLWSRKKEKLDSVLSDLISLVQATPEEAHCTVITREQEKASA